MPTALLLIAAYLQIFLDETLKRNQFFSMVLILSAQISNFLA